MPIKKQAKDNAATQRVEDINGWFEIKNNPISKVGVFPYTGASIGAPEPDKIYKVFRSAEELSHPDCIDSFKLLPWVDDHTMLGASVEGLTPAEEKGIQGVTGEEVYFKDDVLFSNLKLFSEAMANLIEAGKEELSCGYRCVYKFIPGVYNGERYDAIQCEIRGNHLALVDEGRMGPDVAVMDGFTFTIDSKEFTKMPAENETQAQLDAKNKADKEAADKAAKDKSDKEAADKADKEKADKEAADKKEAEDKAAKDKADKEAADAVKLEADKKSGMDAAAVKKLSDEVEGLKKNGIKSIMSEISARDGLAKKISEHVGTFDHSDKTLNEVAEYGVEKLGIKCEKGQEKIALDGFFHNRVAPSQETGYALDGGAAGGKKSFLENFVTAKK